MKAETKYKGAIKLSAIGDALGWITEFESSPESLARKFGTTEISSFIDWEKNVGGRFNGYIDRIKAGSYSDDTQLLLCVARSILPDGTIDNDYFSEVEMPAWLPYSRGAGRTIKNAASKIQRKSAQWNSNFFSFKVGKSTIDYRDSGANGAAMRIMPIVLANLADKGKIKKEVFRNSIVSHGHPRAIIGAMLYAYALDMIVPVNSADFEPASFIVQIGKNFQEKFNLPFLADPKLEKWLIRWNEGSQVDFLDQYNSTLDETQEQLRLIYKGLAPKYKPKEILDQLGCVSNETKSSGIATVVAGIYLLCKFHDAPTDAIGFAVNYFGSDTDSIAAFAGGLIGALHGHSVIPEKWKDVQDAAYLDEIATHLLAISESRCSDIKNVPEKDLRKLTFSNDNYEIGETVYYNTLGSGKVVNIDRQQPITQGKYNLLLDVDFDIGQSCRFSKLISGNQPTANYTSEAIDIVNRVVNEKDKEEIVYELKRRNDQDLNALIIKILKSINK